VVPIAVAAGALQWWWTGPVTAVTSAVWLVVAVALAALVTLTTPMTALLDTIERAAQPLRVVGLDARRVGLVVSLAIRSVPVVADLAAEVRDARRARGAEGSWRAFAVPFVVRSVRHADRLGQALAARGVGDD
jgi:biotin transport system permease protein